MKKFGFFVVALAAIMFTACNNGGGSNDPTPGNLPSGFYVAEKGAALTLFNAMDDGINEVLMDQDKLPRAEAFREGMYEKYIVLEAGKEYQFINKFGEKTQAYGATLEYGDSLIITDNHEIAGYKASLTQGTSFKVNETTLYHIVLDFDKDGKLADVGGAQCIVVPVEWGVRGGMNSWGWTKGDVKKDGDVLTWTWKDMELAAGGEFKFAHNDCWKINLDIAMLVKANTNLGADLLSGGDNIAVEKAGLYDITLTYKASEAKAIAASYTMTVTLTQESTMPTTMYMIGNDFGNWDWTSDQVVTMTPVHSHPGMFWAIRHMTTATQFKWCAQKAWNGDFKSLGTNEGFITPDNAQVEADGIYMILVDLKGDKISVYPAEVYGMGDCFGGWDEGAHPFVVEGTTLTATTAAAGNLRMYAKVAGNEGNWWQSEFNIYDGKIEFRADGGDQAAVAAGAAAKVVLDFNAGTGSINN